MTDPEAQQTNHDPTGNAPMIPRAEVIAILNEVQMIQTKLLILLQRYEPDHFNQTESRQPKAIEPVWSSTDTGHTGSEVVHTVTVG